MYEVCILSRSFLRESLPDDNTVWLLFGSLVFYQPSIKSDSEGTYNFARANIWNTSTMSISQGKAIN